MSLQSCLALLANSSQSLSASALTQLSDLWPDEVRLLAILWPQLPVERRRQVVGMLADLAEDNVEVNFDAVFRLCLGDADAQVRVGAIEGLWENQDRSLLGPLASLMREDADEEVRAAAATALGQFALLAETGELSGADAARVDEAFLATIDDPEETLEVHRRALEAIGIRSLDRVVELIKAAYYSDDPLLKYSALFAMGRNADPRWLPLLLLELKSSDAEARCEAAVACGELEDEKAVPYLVPLMEDEDIQVALAAIESLGHIGGRLAKQTLRKMATNPDERLASAALEALEELGLGDDFTAFRFGD